MSMSLRWRSLLLLGPLLASPAAAQAPKVLGVQARVEVSGAAASTPLDLTARLYDASSGGSEVTSETDAATPSGGVVVTALGDDLPLDPGDFLQPLWAAFEVDGGGELSPRVEVFPAPMSLTAARAASTHARVTYVPARGSASENGAALLAAVGAANSASPTLSEPWVVIVGAGTFDLGGSGLALADYVSLMGLGREASKVAGSAATLVSLGDFGQLVDLELEGTVSSGTGTLVELAGSNVVILRCRLDGDANGATALRGLHGGDAERFGLISTTIELQDLGGFCQLYGVRVDGGGTTRTRRLLIGSEVQLSADYFLSDTDEVVGVFMDDASDRPLILRDSRVNVFNNGGGEAVGLYVGNSNGVDVVASEVRTGSSGGTSFARATRVFGGGQVRVRGSLLQGTLGGTGDTCGGFNVDQDYGAITSLCP